MYKLCISRKCERYFKHLQKSESFRQRQKRATTTEIIKKILAHSEGNARQFECAYNKTVQYNSELEEIKEKQMVLKFRIYGNYNDWTRWYSLAIRKVNLIHSQRAGVNQRKRF